MKARMITPPSLSFFLLRRFLLTEEMKWGSDISLQPFVRATFIGKLLLKGFVPSPPFSFRFGAKSPCLSSVLLYLPLLPSPSAFCTTAKREQELWSVLFKLKSNKMTALCNVHVIQSRFSVTVNSD